MKNLRDCLLPFVDLELAAPLVLVLVLASAPPLLAQNDPDPEQPRDAAADLDEDEDEDEPSLVISADVSSASEVEVEGSQSHFDITSAGIEIETEHFGLSYRKLDFDWEGAESLAFANGSDEPWESLEMLSLSGSYIRPLRPKLALMAGLEAEFAYEDETSDSYTLSLFSGIMWRKSENWSFVFGVGYRWHPEVDLNLEILPLIGFEWRDEMALGFSASLGVPNTELRYRFSPNSVLALSAEGGEDTVARLADDSPVTPAGYVEFSRTTLGLLYRHTIGERWLLSVGANYGLDGEMRIHSSAGERLFTEDLESAVGYTFGLSLSF